jgi:DNA-binding response OmpR family regulator
VKAALRRAGMDAADENDAVLRFGGLEVDLAGHTVRLDGEEVKTTFVEFEILSALARRPGRALSRETLLARVWGDSAYRDPRTVDVHIRHLREKLESDPSEPRMLETVRGVGYRFARPVAVEG